MSILSCSIVLLIWLYLLWVLDRAKLPAWRYIWGSLGFFTIMMIWVQPHVYKPLARCVAALSGVVGNITGAFVTYFKYGTIFVTSASQSLTLQIDFECSGIIEILVFLALLLFFRVYSVPERVLIGVVGVAYIMLANAFRIIIICLSTHWFGLPAYYVSHVYIGRIIFYMLSVVLYFYVFTKPQIVKMKVGNFSYGINKSNS